MENKVQVVYIHGGMTFKDEADYLLHLKTREISIDDFPFWPDSLAEQLGDGFQVIKPRMPLKDNARYEDWKINFERHFSFIKDDVILVGFSLGGTFLAQYLSENRFPRKIHSTYIIAAPFESMPGEDLAGGFRLQSDLSLLSENCPRLRFLFSSTDNVVPLEHAALFAAKLPKAELIVYEHINGHFLIGEFPELIEMIKTDGAQLK